MHLISYFKQPFPKGENQWRSVVLISLFVTLFLFVFQPFGLVRIESNMTKYLFIGGFGLVTFVILFLELIVVEHVFQSVFKEQNWTLYKELLWLFCIIFSIGIGNMMYALLFTSQGLTLAYIMSYQLVTFAVAVFPITLFTITKNNYLMKKYATSASGMNVALHPETTPSQEHKKHCMYSYNEKANVTFVLDELYFIESQGNDIVLNLYDARGMATKSLRNTLKQSLQQLVDAPELVQCHRAYIVNLSKVIKVEGNSQGLVLKLKNSDVDIPVSRSFVSSIKRKLS